jgi:hypothetical protein
MKYMDSYSWFLLGALTSWLITVVCLGLHIKPAKLFRRKLTTNPKQNEAHKPQ